MGVKWDDEQVSGVKWDDEQVSGVKWDDEPSRKNTWDESVMARGTALLEGLTGFGDEIAAGGQTALGQLFSAIDPNMEMGDWGQLYDINVKNVRDAVAREREDAGGTMLGLELAAALPTGMKASMAVGNAATRAGNIARQAGVGATEMAVRELGAGEGSFLDRVEQFDPTSTAVGAAVGGLGGALMRGGREIARAEQSAIERTRLGAGVAHVRDDIYSNMAKEVDPQAARTMVNADAQAMRWKQQLHNEENLPVDALETLNKAFLDNPQAAKLVSDANAVVNGAKAPMAMRRGALDAAEAVLRRSNPEAADTFVKMQDTVKRVQQDLRRVFPGMADDIEDNYMAIMAKSKNTPSTFRRSKTARRTDSSAQQRTTGYVTPDQAAKGFETPVHAFMNFFEDSVDALALARKYGVKTDTQSIKQVGSFTDEVIKAIEKKEAARIGADKAKDLGEYLRLYAIDGRTGMGELASVLRMGAHAALLGTPENAVLQIGDLGASAYATSFRDAIGALPKSLRSMLLTDGDMVVSNGYNGTIRAADIGISRQHLTELVNESDRWLPKQVSKLSNALMTVSGVRGMNRLGQETLLNAQYSHMKRLAKQGRDVLAKSKYAEGLDERGIDRLMRGLESGVVKDPAVLDAVFFGLGRIQPVARSAMPPAYLDAKNGRLLWSMKMYMTKMASRLNDDVFGKLREAERAGLNTDKGRALFGEAVKNTARYTTFIVALNAMIDPSRKELFRGKENENTFPEELARQGISFASGGLIDPNNIRYGRTVSESFIPPTIAAATSPIELMVQGLMTDKEVSPEQVESAAKYIPGIRQLLWLQEVGDQ